MARNGGGVAEVHTAAPEADLLSRATRVAEILAMKAVDTQLQSMAADLTPAPPPGPPVRICPKIQLTNNSDIPAGNFGPAGTYDICQYAEVGMTGINPDIGGYESCFFGGGDGTPTHPSVSFSIYDDELLSTRHERVPLRPDGTRRVGLTEVVHDADGW